MTFRYGRDFMSNIKTAYSLALALVPLLALAAQSARAASPAEFDCLLVPHDEITLGSPVPGVIEMLKVRKGDFVKKGAVIARLESSVQKADLALARARAESDVEVRLKTARLDYETRRGERNRRLFEKNLLSAQELDDIEADRMSAELELEQARERRAIARLELARAEAVYAQRSIKSPVSGVVVERFLSPGEFVEQNRIVTISQLDPLDVEVFLPAPLFGAVKPGMAAEVWPDEPIDGPIIATVRRVDRVIDAASARFGVRLELPNRNSRIPAGLRCRVRFEIE